MKAGTMNELAIVVSKHCLIQTSLFTEQAHAGTRLLNTAGDPSPSWGAAKPLPYGGNCLWNCFNVAVPDQARLCCA